VRARPFENEEPDFTVGTELAIEPFTFEQVVREAFQLEHSCTQNQEIAQVIGKDKSWITHIFKPSTKLDAEGIQNLIKPLKNRRHKRRILTAWVKDRFGLDITDPVPLTVVGKPVTAKVLRRVDRQIRESRLFAAATTATEGADKADDPILREQFLDRAYFARQRLEQPGHAMMVARQVVEGGRELREPLREAMGQLLRARTLLGMLNSKPGDLAPIFEAVANLLDVSPAPSTHPPYQIAKHESLVATIMGARITYVERGLVQASASELRQMLNEVLGWPKASRPFQKRFLYNVLAARICLLLGETFHAQEHVESAFRSGDLQNLQAMEACGVVQGRILALVESPEVASQYLRKMSLTCINTDDYYHQRTAEYELARIQNGLFPN